MHMRVARVEAESFITVLINAERDYIAGEVTGVLVLEDVFARRNGPRREQRGSWVRRRSNTAGNEWSVDVPNAHIVHIFAPIQIAACVPVLGKVVFCVEISNEGGLLSE